MKPKDQKDVDSYGTANHLPIEDHKVQDKINGRVLENDGIKEYTLDADATEIIGEKADALFTYNEPFFYTRIWSNIFDLTLSFPCFMENPNIKKKRKEN